MTRHSYSYVPIRYVHDVVAGEQLNVGVVMFAPTANFIEAKLADRRTHRLAETFNGFDVDLHRLALKELRAGLSNLKARGQGSQGAFFSDRVSDAGGLLRLLWPDKGTQYTFGEVGFGVADNLVRTLDRLFKRYVENQMPGEDSDDRVKDEQVWNRVLKSLRPRVPTSKLQKETVDTPSGPIELPYTYKNGKLNVFQPLSFDLADDRSISRKANTWFGMSVSLRQVGDVGPILYVVGPPRSQTKLATFNRAVGFLKTADVSVYRETELDLFVEQAEKLVGSRRADS